MAVTLKGPGAKGKSLGKPLGTDYSQYLGPKHSSHQATGSVTKEKLYQGKQDGPVEEEVEVVHPGIVIPPHRLCRVEVQGSRTVNLGKYESARITVGITMPSDIDEIAETYEFAQDWITERISKALDEQPANS